MSEIADKVGMGWLPDYPDFRDHTTEHEEIPARSKAFGQKDSIKVMLAKVGVAKIARASLPISVDLKSWFSPVEDQGSLGSCAANAGIGICRIFRKEGFWKVY
jgi:C1A family cysteine protease